MIRLVIVEPEGTLRDYSVSARNYRIYNTLVDDFVCMTDTSSGELCLPLVKQEVSYLFVLYKISKIAFFCFIDLLENQLMKHRSCHFQRGQS